MIRAAARALYFARTSLRGIAATPGTAIVATATITVALVLVGAFGLVVLNMQALLVDLWKEARATVFFVTHSIEEAVFLGDRVYVFSSAPGTILRELVMPAPDRPPQEMQRDPAFVERVFEIRDIMEGSTSSTRSKDD